MGSMRSVVVGVFVVGGLALFAAGLFLIGDRRLLFAPRFELNTTFNKVSGLQVGTRVRVAGLDAGEVLEVQIPLRPSEPFRVRMRLREDTRQIVRTDSVCAVQTDGIVGNAFIQVGRGSDAAPVVESGATIAGQDPVELSDLIQEGRVMFQTVTDEIGDLSDDLSNTVGSLADLARSANGVIADVGGDVKVISGTAVRLANQAELLVADARRITDEVREGRGTIGRLLTDDTLYQRFVLMADKAEQTVSGMRDAAEQAKALLNGVSAKDGAAQQIVQTLRDTMVDTREVISDLTESTEALKRNFLFRGFFQDRGFFDLDTISRQAYQAGALEGKDRTALRVWIAAEGLFSRTSNGVEQLTEPGRRRIDSAMADLVRYPRGSPLIVEGYADGSGGETAYLLSFDRAVLVREYLVSRFRRRVTITGAMPMSEEAIGSPSGDQRWSGVALALFVATDALEATR